MKKNLAGKTMIAVLAAALALSGCAQKAPRMREEGATVAKATEAPETKADGKEASEKETISPEQMELLKYNYYVEMNNDIVEILDNIDNYYKVVDYTEEFSLIPDSGLTYGYRVYGLNSDDVDVCLELSYMEPSYDALDPIVREIAEPLRDLMDTFSKVGKGDYAANQYEKPKEYHAVIYPLTEKFEELADQFLYELGVIADEKIAQEEEMMKAEGLFINYYASRALTIAKEIQNEYNRQGVTDENITEMDLTNIKPLYDELVATVNDLNTAAADNDQMIKESLSNSRPFNQLYESLIQALEWMIRQVESGRPIEDTSLEPLGSIAHFSNTLGKCIDRYNTIFTD